MTDRERRAWIISVLRRASMRWPARDEAKRAARIGRSQYRCARCGEIFPSKGIQMDHRAPVGQFTDWNTFCDRLLCTVSNYQVPCLKCYEDKAAEERGKVS